MGHDERQKVLSLQCANWKQTLWVIVLLCIQLGAQNAFAQSTYSTTTQLSSSINPIAYGSSTAFTALISAGGACSYGIGVFDQ